MKDCLKYLVCLILLSPVIDFVSAQTGPVVSSVEIELIDDKLVVGYNIEKYEKKDLFTVWIEITDSLENPLGAESFTGDLGDSIKGGKGKEIIWDLVKDSIVLSENIFIEVKAEREIPELVVEIEPEKIAEEKTDELLIDNRTQKSELDTWKLMLRSTVFPGWGSASITNKKVYLLMGAVGYGSLTTSYIYYRKAIASYGIYEEATDATVDRNTELYNQAVKEAKYSRIFAYTSLAIWATDLVFVAVRSSAQFKQAVVNQNSIELYSYYSYQANCPMIGFAYHF